MTPDEIAYRIVHYSSGPGDIERAIAREITRLREQYARSQRYWIEAAELAIQKGDFRPLKFRIDASEAGPTEFTETY